MSDAQSIPSNGFHPSLLIAVVLASTYYMNYRRGHLERALLELERVQHEPPGLRLNRDVRSVQLLLAKEGIRVNQATHDDATSNSSMNDRWTPPGPFASVTPLRIAAQHGQLEVVRVLVEQDGIDLDKPGKTNEKFGFESPLQVAREGEYEAIVEVLLDAGAEDDLLFVLL